MIPHEKKNIAHLITGLNAGGAERMVFHLSTKINQNEFLSQVITLNSHSTQLISEFKKNKIKVTLLELKKNIFNTIAAIFKLLDVIKKSNIKIVHAHLFHALVVAACAKILNPYLVIIWTSHSKDQTSWMRRIIVFLLLPIRKCDIIFTKNMNTWFVKKKYYIIHNGIEITSSMPEQPKYNKFTFISIGRLEEVKNQKYLIETFAKIKNENMQLKIVGTGSQYATLNNIIEKNSLNDSVELLGFRDDVISILQKSHCFVLPSLREGMPLTLLESGYFKIPIIASFQAINGGIIELDEGYVVDIEDFKETMLEVMNNYQNALLKAGKFYIKVMNKFSIQSCVQLHEELYSSVVDG